MSVAAAAPFVEHVREPYSGGASLIGAIGDLYRSASFVDRGQYRSWALRTLSVFVPFDAALWATGASPGIDLADALLLSLPRDFVLGAELDGDPLRNGSSDAPVPFVRDIFKTDELPPAVREHYGRYGIRSGLCVQCINALTGVSHVIALFSFGRSVPGSTCPRTLELLSQALVDASSFSFLLQLRPQAGLEGRKATAICSSDVVLECQPAFASLIREVDPHWTGPRLPFKSADAVGKPFVYGPMAVTMDPFEQLCAVRIWKVNELDELSAREEQMVSKALAGLTDKEIATELGLSASTVSNRLAAAFKKLGVTSRQHLRKKYATPC